MLYILKIDYCLKILTNDEVKDFVAIRFSKYFKSARENYFLILVNKNVAIRYI